MYGYVLLLAIENVFLFAIPDSTVPQHLVVFWEVCDFQ